MNSQQSLHPRRLCCLDRVYQHAAGGAGTPVSIKPAFHVEGHVYAGTTVSGGTSHSHHHSATKDRV